MITRLMCARALDLSPSVVATARRVVEDERDAARRIGSLIAHLLDRNTTNAFVEGS
jgi:hypothetical protein